MCVCGRESYFISHLMLILSLSFHTFLQLSCQLRVHRALLQSDIQESEAIMARNRASSVFLQIHLQQEQPHGFTFFFFNCSYQPGKGKHWGASSIWPLFVDNITTVWFAVDGKKQYRSCRNVVRPMHGEYIGTIQQNVFHGQKRGNTQNHTATSTSKLSLIRKQ